MKTHPACSKTSPTRDESRCTFTPSASSTSALPHFDVNALFPCFTTLAPAPAATNIAAVEILRKPALSPPVPHSSRRGRGSLRSRVGITAFPSSIRANPASSAAVSPRAWRSRRKRSFVSSGARVPMSSSSERSISGIPREGIDRGSGNDSAMGFNQRFLIDLKSSQHERHRREQQKRPEQTTEHHGAPVAAHGTFRHQ